MLDEAVPEQVRGEILAPYHEVVDRQAPVYWQVTKSNGGTPTLRYHRLLLPVTCGGPAIAKVIVGIYADPPRQPKKKTVYDVMAAAEVSRAWGAAR